VGYLLPVGSKFTDNDQVIAGLKLIYLTPTETEAEAVLKRFAQSRDATYPTKSTSGD
jgi:hypothetical protein